MLSKLFATLKEDHAELENTYSLQRKTRAEKVKVKTMEVKQTLFYRLTDLFSSIEMAALGHPEVDYAPLIDELNQEVYQLKIGTLVKSLEDTAKITDIGLNNSCNRFNLKLTERRNLHLYAGFSFMSQMEYVLSYCIYNSSEKLKVFKGLITLNFSKVRSRALKTHFQY